LSSEEQFQIDPFFKHSMPSKHDLVIVFSLKSKLDKKFQIKNNVNKIIDKKSVAKKAFSF